MAAEPTDHTPMKVLRDQVTHYTNLARAHRSDVERSMAKAESAELKAQEFADAVALMERALAQ